MNADGPNIAVWSFLIVAMLALILLVGIIALLSFKATRPLAVGLIVFFLGGAFLLFVGLFFVRASAVPQQATVATYPQPPYYESHGAQAVPPSVQAPQYNPAPVSPDHAMEQVTTPQPGAAQQAQAFPPDSVPPLDTGVQATPAEVAEPTSNSDLHGEPAVNPTNKATPADKPVESATPSAEAVPAAPAAEAPAATPESVPAQVTPASPPPSTTIVAEKLPAAPVARPSWVDAPPHREQNVYQVAVKSGLFVTAAECERALEKAMQRSVDAYIDEYIEEGAAELVAIEPHFIQQRIRRGAFSDTAESSVGTMQQAYGLLVFDDGVQSLFQQRWRQALVKARLWQVGAGSAAVLGLIGTLFGFLTWGQKSAVSQPTPSVVAEKSGAVAATYNHFWLHCALVVAILIGVLALFGWVPF